MFESKRAYYLYIHKYKYFVYILDRPTYTMMQKLYEYWYVVLRMTFVG